MEVYIIRHGTTDWNKAGRFQGSVDIELNEEGRKLATALGKKLKDISFDKIFSSPLKRAYETASLVRGSRDIEIVTDQKLTEIGFGGLEGTPYTEWVNTEHPRKYFFTAPEKYLPPEGGETFESVCQRAKNFVVNEIEPLYKSNPDGRYMIVAHGTLLAGIILYFENSGIEKLWGNGLKGNCEATIYGFDGSKWFLKSEDTTPKVNPYEAKVHENK